jgi:tetratricopeptide (TPR) repeat protein
MILVEESRMKIRFGLVLAMALGLGISGCASGGGGSAGGGLAGAVSGGGGAGINPRNTDNTRAAQSAISAAEDSADPAEARMHYQTALAAAEAAMAEDPMNPLAHRLAGIAALGVDDFEGAAAHFDKAVELRPLYEFDLVGIREGAWIDQYEEATPYVQTGDYETAAQYFENANAIYRQRPEAMITLGQIYAQLREHDKALANLDAALAFETSDAMTAVDSTTAAGWMESMEGLPMLRAQVLADAGRFEEAVGTYREMSAASPGDIELKRGLAVILSEMGNEAEATALYEEMLGMPGLTASDYFAIGVGFYQNNDYTRAVRAFSGAATASVNDRDAIEMWARSLQLDSAYAAIPPVADRWIKLDPNSQNAYLIMAQAANQNGDQVATQRAIQVVDGLDVVVNDLQLRRNAGGGGTVAGSVVNKKLNPGASVTLRFTFYAEDGSPLGTVNQSVSVGAANMAEVVRVEFDSARTVGGYGYTLTIG